MKNKTWVFEWKLIGLLLLSCANLCKVSEDQKSATILKDQELSTLLSSLHPFILSGFSSIFILGRSFLFSSVSGTSAVHTIPQINDDMFILFLDILQPFKFELALQALPVKVSPVMLWVCESPSNVASELVLQRRSRVEKRKNPCIASQLKVLSDHLNCETGKRKLDRFCRRLQGAHFHEVGCPYWWAFQFSFFTIKATPILLLTAGASFISSWRSMHQLS